MAHLFKMPALAPASDLAKDLLLERRTLNGFQHCYLFSPLPIWGSLSVLDASEDSDSIHSNSFIRLTLASILT